MKFFSPKILENTYLRRLLYFFPLRLILVHLKHNHFLILFWLIITGFVTKWIGPKYGIAYLFLNPEYLGDVNFLSFFITGFSFGGFVMAYNISSYIVNGHRFPFIATISKPFFKYSVNNSLFPLVFIGIYLYHLIVFHRTDEFKSWSTIAEYIGGYFSGYVVFIILSLTYFFSTNKDFKKLFGKDPDEAHEEAGKHSEKPIKAMLHKKVSWYNFLNSDREWSIETYLSSPFTIRLARNISHYDNEMLKRVFTQNHLNATVFEIIIILSIIVINFFGENPYFTIPVAASVTLLFTMLIMVTSAIHSWFRGWASTIVILLLVALNFSSKFEIFSPSNHAFGLNYQNERATFSAEKLAEMTNEEQQIADKKNGLQILENWYSKHINNPNRKTEKPVMVFFCTSGGGLRSTLWSFQVLRTADSLLNGGFMNHTHLITGSSGGMVGAAYYRELYLRQRAGQINSTYNRRFVDNVSHDLLNAVGFHMVANDMLYKFRSFNDGKYEYKIDRGYAFEKQFHKNTEYVLNKRLGDYIYPEWHSIIPMMVITPTIANDGRQLIISTQPSAFLAKHVGPRNLDNEFLVDGIEFRKLFRENDADNLHFASALRMSSTFPYIMPLVELPSTPSIEVIDAGVRDNYGKITLAKFLNTYKDWLEEHTSKIVIVQTRDRKKDFPISANSVSSLFKSFVTPLGSIYDNLFQTQDLSHDGVISYTAECLQEKMIVMDFALENEAKNNISLSWHLTTKEKKQVLNSIYSEENQKKLEKLVELLKP